VTTKERKGKAIDVLLIEDNPDDVRLFQRALRHASQEIHLHVAADGVKGMAFLSRDGEYGDAPRPDLILLDLHMPNMDGRTVLSHIKASDSLKSIPTIVLSSSESGADIDDSYKLRANSYLSKPVRLDKFEDLVASILDLWLNKAKLPKKGN
jgi:two-component system, chemotaxis family, response regulator Rcp1